MKELIKIGIVIADDCEYAPIRDKIEALDAKEANFYKREGHIFSFKNEERRVEVHTILCGIGMINAAAAATFLADKGVDIIFNSGLSGGISGISRNELMVGDCYIEHDFDLTPLGYEPCEKPLQNYVYKADTELIELFKKICPQIKVGVAVSGDSFISDNEKRDFLKTKFNAMSCDMESAAVAYVCENADIKYVALRRVSDDAGDDAKTTYSDMNEKKEAVLIDILIEASRRILQVESFWK